jgi:hypothetical protein
MDGGAGSHRQDPLSVHLPDVRTPVPLDADTRREHRAVMPQ